MYQDGHKLPQMPVKYVAQLTKNFKIFSTLRPSKANPNWIFWFESKPSGNPGAHARFRKDWISVLTALLN
jgi:hypothetical protein